MRKRKRKRDGEGEYVAVVERVFGNEEEKALLMMDEIEMEIGEKDLVEHGATFEMRQAGLPYCSHLAGSRIQWRTCHSRDSTAGGSLQRKTKRGR